MLLLLVGFVYLGSSQSNQIRASTRFISIWVKEKYDAVISIEALPFLLNNINNVNPPKLNNGKASSIVSASIHRNDIVSLILILQTQWFSWFPFWLHHIIPIVDITLLGFSNGTMI